MFRKIEDLKNAPPEAGALQEFEDTYERVLEAVRKAIVSAGLAIKETDAVGENQTTILAEKGISALSWGELVRVVVQRSSAHQTVVRVLTMRRLAMNITAKGDYSETVFASISKSLMRG